MTFQGATLVQH